ncbi:hypothetical protein MTsPCn5_25690 [Croceitalea sp. MTPC5]|uniref:hypothetical protein n=1 Tax=Croceitalea sp. MTPC5 TaxID=3056565 RepID=UPI002B38AD34|nr:hypothetical protein MTsPCn5_25690 [Croceitalea sp. MTPC5]
MIEKYKALNIAIGDYNYVVNEKGENIDGNFEEEVSYDSFKFFNNTTGWSEIVDVNTLQNINTPKVQ